MGAGVVVGDGLLLEMGDGALDMGDGALEMGDGVLHVLTSLERGRARASGVGEGRCMPSPV